MYQLRKLLNIISSRIKNKMTDELTDLISKMENLSPIDELNKKIQKEPTKKWIKEIDISKELHFESFKHYDKFIKVADIIEDTEINKKGDKRRKTEIMFKPVIEKSKWNSKAEWIYIFLMDNKIIKIGGTRTGLSGRCGSYLCGQHVPERGKSGDCSKTNAYIYNSFVFYLKNKYKIEMYGYELPHSFLEMDIFGKTTKVEAQTFHAFESRCLEEYKKETGKYPILSCNADPNFK